MGSHCRSGARTTYVASLVCHLDASEEPVEQILRWAWSRLPPANRTLLEAIGAAKWEVITEPIGSATDHRLYSANPQDGLAVQDRERLNPALAAWVPPLRLVLVNEKHPSLAGLDAQSRKWFVARTAWHEWGHALSIERCTYDDIKAGDMLMEHAPAAISERVRTARYRRSEYTHEVIADIYAILVERRHHGRDGRPAWLDPTIYSLLARLTAWTG